MKYRLVLWDFDGTLADTLTTALEVYNRLAAQHGFRAVTDPQSIRDMNMRDFLREHGVPRYRVPFLFSTFLSEVRHLASDIALTPGIVKVVRTIADEGMLQAVVSSNNTDSIQTCLAAHDIVGCFQQITGTSRLFGKQSGIRAAAKKLKVSLDEALYVGDEVRDVEAAQAAGLDIAAVTWGLNSRVILKQSHPHYLCDRPTQLTSILCPSATTG